ncbi:MAG: hypothetical protein JWO56_3647 [Acidobacteria bacterium]|nr:hypothetical protein [Acidobacteriota bacterium]
MADELETTVDDAPSPEIGLSKGAAHVKNAGKAFLETLGDKAASTKLIPPDKELEAAEAGEQVTADDAEEESDEQLEQQREAGAEVADDAEPTAEEIEAMTDAEFAAYEAKLAAAAKEVKKDAPAPAGAIVLKGMEERGEDDLEIEIDDPAVAERIRRLQNDGMRATEYKAKVATVEARDQELDEIEATMAQNPEGFVLTRIQPAVQVNVLKALLAKHFDNADVQAQIDGYIADPMKVREDRIDLRDRTAKADTATQTAIANRRAAREILNAATALVPDTVKPEILAEFIKDAERDLIDAVNAGARIAPADVPRLLAKRVKMYGFAHAARPDAAAARPVSDRAKAIAARKAEIDAKSARTKRIQVARKAGSAIPSGGRGATSVSKPLVKKGSDIKAASKAVLRSGATTWADVGAGGGKR